MTISRRAMIVGSTASVGCFNRNVGMPSRESSSVACDVRAFARGFSGELLQAGDAHYASMRFGHNARHDASGASPFLIARCRNEHDVRETIAFARACRIRVVARSGGHSYAGYSNTSGILIDLSLMNAIGVESSAVTIGAGALLVDVYDTLKNHGVSIPGGSCPSVGIAGLTLGGGMGVVGRKYGLTCDRLRAATLVTAEGRLITCNTTHNSDLYWALRGGGGGNFGVVTQLVFEPYRLSELTTFRYDFLWKHAAEVFAAWQQWGPLAPDDVWSAFRLDANGKVGELPEVEFAGACVGSESDLKLHLSAFFDRIKTEPRSSKHQSFAPRDIVKGIADCDEKTVPQCHKSDRAPEGQLKRNAFVATSDFFDRVLPESAMHALLSNVAQRQASGRVGMVLLDALGGAINRVLPHETAFVHRNDRFSAQYLAEFPEETHEAVLGEASDWVREIRATMKPWSSGRAYQNYIDPRLVDWKAAYYAGNAERLEATRRKWDPERFFGFAQGV